MPTPPIDYASGSRKSSRFDTVLRDIRRVVVGLLIVFVGLPALLVGTLLAINLLIPPRSAEAQFRSDLGVGLPPSAQQLHGARVPGAFMDPATHYELHVAPAELPAWLNSVKASAASHLWDDKVMESISSTMSPPAWWTPAADADTQKLTIANTYASGNGMTIYYSLSSGRVFVFWWRT